MEEKQLAVLGTCQVCKHREVQVFQYDHTEYRIGKGYVVFYYRLCSRCFRKAENDAQKAVSYEYVLEKVWREFFQECLD